ncbi:MAG TPA: GreA/GreB family elongation factor [bacterium]|nr:GreA/GreB family elongation factor [bacterium]
MRVPIRKGGKYTFIQTDPHLTQAKFDELSRKLSWLKKIGQPRAIVEVQRLAELGDFSENAAYQIAKGKLRGINQKIFDLEDHLKKAIIISQPTSGGFVRLGSTVTVEINGRSRTFQILGSTETNPGGGVISHNSPIGAAVMDRRVGDTVKVSLANGKVDCRIIQIN